jgi:hypothetical protein
VSDYLWFAISILGVAAFAIYGIMRQLRLKRARSWPVVSGVVTSTVVRLENRGNNQSIWAAEVLYSYTILETAYSGRSRRTFLLKGWADNGSAGIRRIRQ